MDRSRRSSTSLEREVVYTKREEKKNVREEFHRVEVARKWAEDEKL